MAEYKIGNATVRIHGSADPEYIKEATTAFIKRAEAQKRKSVRKERKKK